MMPAQLGLDAALHEVWRAALVEPGSAVDAVVVGEVLRHLPGRRATCSAVRGGDPVVVKVFVSPRARGNDRRLRSLAEAGLGDLVPASLGVAADGRVGVLGFRPGAVLDTVDDATFVEASRAVGVALARLHGSGAELDRAWTHADEVSQLLRRVPESVDAAARFVAALPVGEVGLVPSHRDLHPRQVVVGERADKVAFIDLDDAALAPPGVDVGNMVAHLRREALVGRRTVAVAEAAVAAFLTGYAAPPPDLAVWERLALVRLAGLAETRHGIPAERDALLALLAARGDTEAAGTPAPTLSGRTARTVATGHADRPVSVLTGADGRAVVVKRYLGADGGAIFDQMCALWASPFGAARGAGPGMPQPLAFDPRTGDLTMSHLPGPALGTRGDLGRTLELGAQAGELLADLHGSGVVLDRVRDRAGLLRSTGRKVAERRQAEGGADFDRALEAIRAAWADTEPGPLVPSHGDFSPRNVLVGPSRLALIDFDRMQLAEPARDLAYWSAWVWVTAVLSGASAGDPWALSEPFMAAYLRRAGTGAVVTPADLAVHRAVALVRIAHGWSALRTDTPARTRILDMAVTLARGGTAGTDATISG